MNNCQDCLRWEGKENDLRSRCSLLGLQVGRFGTCPKFTRRPPDWSCLVADKRPARGWWAPGDYMNTCRKCGKGFVGDKRAVHCADCAYAGPTNRGSGRTTGQMLEAPMGAVFVWCGSNLDYPRLLAERIGRTDLQLERLSWLLDYSRLAGRRIPAVIVDHAAEILPDVWETIVRLRDHGTLVRT